MRSERNHLEDNYRKYININTNNEITAKINNIKIITTRLGNILSKEERNTVREELYKIENKGRLTKKQKEKTHAFLNRLLNTLNNKQKYRHSDHHKTFA